MASRNYWLDLFSLETWQKFHAAGGEVSGFSESRWLTVQKIKPRDYLLCYLTGASRFIGVLEVVSAAYKDTTPIWTSAAYPCRVKVKPLIELTPETAVPVRDVGAKLSFAADFESRYQWTGRFRGSPVRWSATDGEIVVLAVTEASQNPISRTIDPAKLRRRPQGIKAKIGLVTVPEQDSPLSQAPEPVEEATAHTEIQWLLLKLGIDVGHDVWVARNDRSKDYKGSRYTSLPSLKSSLPLQFDEATNKTIELIDVLWLKGNAIVAAFEIESTTSIYSGLLRMSDLVAMQPNLNILLYLVAPDERRDKVLIEVNRPTFSRLKPALSEVCRYIAFTDLRKKLSEVAPYVRYLKPEFLEELSESCEIDDV